MTRRRIAVIGASLAGLRAAEQLRAQGYDDDFVIIGAEPSSCSGGARRYTSALAMPLSMSTRDRSSLGDEVGLQGSVTTDRGHGFRALQPGASRDGSAGIRLTDHAS